MLGVFMDSFSSRSPKLSHHTVSIASNRPSATSKSTSNASTHLFNRKDYSSAMKGDLESFTKEYELHEGENDKTNFVQNSFIVGFQSNQIEFCKNIKRFLLGNPILYREIDEYSLHSESLIYKGIASHNTKLLEAIIHVFFPMHIPQTMSKDVDHLSTSDEFEYPPFPPPKLRRTPPSDSYIHFAVQHNNIAAVNLLLKYNFDEIDEPRRYGHTPLHQAIQLKYEDMAKFLLSRGANANSMSVSPSCRGFGYDDWSVGESPLHLSISLQLDKVTHLLMENGANPFQEGVLRGSVTDENRITPLELSTLLGKQIPSQYIARNFNVEQFIPILDICLLQNNAPRLNLLLDSIPIQSLK